MRNGAHRQGAGPATRRDDVARARAVNTAPPGQSAILALVDEIAVLAADLWFAGKLDHLRSGQEMPSAEDD